MAVGLQDSGASDGIGFSEKSLNSGDNVLGIGGSFGLLGVEIRKPQGVSNEKRSLLGLRRVVKGGGPVGDSRTPEAGNKSRCS